MKLHVNYALLRGVPATGSQTNRPFCRNCGRETAPPSSQAILTRLWPRSCGRSGTLSASPPSRGQDTATTGVYSSLPPPPSEGHAPPRRSSFTSAGGSCSGRWSPRPRSTRNFGKDHTRGTEKLYARWFTNTALCAASDKQESTKLYSSKIQNENDTSQQQIVTDRNK
ncbi:unnamed protein product [Nezara viridula]|uniref:Uncharacterized protein n=1 Tax=Nezara viridula TaxID=85310 RepID=A0A9P0H1U0_NEZVI|nr:unnamed protein product [Nezara viridula]